MRFQVTFHKFQKLLKLPKARCIIGVMPKRSMNVKRPYGLNMRKGVRVALTQELDSALRYLRRNFGVSKSHVIRAGIMTALATKIPEAVAIARDPTASPSMRLKMAEFLRACAKAEASLREPELAAAVRKTKRKSRPPDLGGN